MNRVIIAGTRTIIDYNIVEEAIKKSGFVIDEVVSGGALGVDTLGEFWAEENNVPVKLFIPDWKSYGAAAGIYRNTEMAIHASHLIAVWDGISTGTKHMISIAKKMKLKIYVHLVGVNQIL